MRSRRPSWKDARESILYALRGPNLVITCVALLGALFFIDQFTLLGPSNDSVNTTMKILPENARVPIVSTGARGCGNYWRTESFGFEVKASIQIAAGFCWNNKDVRWVWGLQRGNCRPVVSAGVRVQMTCQISGGHNGPISIMYTAQIQSSLLPFIQRTEVLGVTVFPGGRVDQFTLP